MNDYISKVVNKLRTKAHKQEIGRELQDHIEERTAYYISTGCDEKTARRKANDAMGEDAEAVGFQLSQMHQDYSFLNIIFALINTVMLFFFLAYIIASLSCVGDRNMLLFSGADVLTAFFIITLAELYFAVKHKLMFTVVSITVNMLFYAVVTNGFVPCMFALYKILRGELHSYIDLTASYIYKVENRTVSILSVLFIVSCLFLSVASMYVIRKLSKLKYGLKTAQFERVLKGIVLALLLLVTAVFGCTCIATDKAYDGETVCTEIDGVCVIESDEIVDPASIENYDDNYLMFHSDWGSEDVHDENGTFFYNDAEKDNIECSSSLAHYRDIDRDVLCKVNSVYAEFKPTKKYVMVVPRFCQWDKEDYAGTYHCYIGSGEWLDTSEEHIVTLDDSYTLHNILFKTTMKIHKR